MYFLRSVGGGLKKKQISSAMIWTTYLSHILVRKTKKKKKLIPDGHADKVQNESSEGVFNASK